MANHITTLGQKEEALSEQYDKATVDLKADEAKVVAASHSVKKADASEAKAKGVLKVDAVDAYVHTGTAGATMAGTGSLKSANSGLLRAEYVSSLAANQADDQDAFHLASVKAQTAKQNLQTAEAAQQKQVATLATAKSNVKATQANLEAVYNSENGQIATLVAKIQAKKEAEEQAEATAAANRAAQEQAEQAAQQQVTEDAEAAPTTTTPAPETPVAGPPVTEAPTPEALTPSTDEQTTTTTVPSADVSPTDVPTTAAPVTDPPTTEPVTDPPTTAPPTTEAPAPATPPASGVGSAAVAAAETQLGVPYVFGGATPGVGFDCSGLVMWAYAQVGVSLPHYSGAQFSAGVQIPMSDLEPGDLVFFSDPGEHVAMYVGGGDIIEAPQTGETVHIVPMYSEFTLAVRIS